MISQIKDIEIPIPTFAFNIANIFEVVARAAISESLKNTDWEVFDGNDNSNEYEVLKSNESKEGNDEFYINGTVKPDIIIRKKDEKEYIIIDVKYKSPENKNRMDRLQILAYAYLYDAHIVGHIVPQKSNETDKELSFYNINTPLGDYKYVELYLDGSLKENIEKIKKKLLGMKNETSNN